VWQWRGGSKWPTPDFGKSVKKKKTRWQRQKRRIDGSQKKKKIMWGGNGWGNTYVKKKIEKTQHTRGAPGEFLGGGGKHKTSRETTSSTEKPAKTPSLLGLGSRSTDTSGKPLGQRKRYVKGGKDENRKSKGKRNKRRKRGSKKDKEEFDVGV